MSSYLTTAIVAACLLASVWLGMRLHRFLPEHHLSPDGRGNMKLAMGLVATMTALVLGLLVSSAKTSYDTTRSQVMAPPNATARLASCASALCVAGAIFLILELDRPFGGLLR
ncbi:MAG: hypothetical protein WCO94_17355, partial [Verrucomicrobiota bacterium]